VKIQLNVWSPKRGALLHPYFRQKHPNNFVKKPDFDQDEQVSVYRIIAIAIVLFILASAGYAQVPSGNVFVGYS
jgi:hypothetical protein